MYDLSIAELTLFSSIDVTINKLKEKIKEYEEEAEKKLQVWGSIIFRVTLNMCRSTGKRGLLKAFDVQHVYYQIFFFLWNITYSSYSYRLQ